MDKPIEFEVGKIELPEPPTITFPEYSTLGLGPGFTPDQQALQLISIIANAIDRNIDYNRNFILELERYKEQLKELKSL